MQKRSLLLGLYVFSATGGIEKMSRILGKALNETQADLQVFSMHDDETDANDQYFPINRYKAFKGNKIAFAVQAIAAGRRKEMVVLTHINLLSVGYIIKLLSPSTNLVLLAHGIEVWKNFSGLKKNDAGKM